MRKNILQQNDLIPTRLLKKSEREAIPDRRPTFIRIRFPYVMLKLILLFLGDLYLKLIGKPLSARNERKRRIIESLNRVWIAVAQALTLRGGMLASDLGMQLINLKDKGGKTPFPVMKKVVETELNCPLDTVFDHFEEIPFSATSLAQIHLAKLKKEQAWVAVKIHQPNAEKLYEKDLKILNRIGKILSFFSIQTNMRWEELYAELCDIKEKELNYYYEAAALNQLDSNLSGLQVHVPRLYKAHCRKRVLVMEYLQGALLSDYFRLKAQNPLRARQWLKKNNIDPKIIAKNLFHSVYRQVFEDNFFHGDMNTENIILLRDSHLAVIECKSAGSLERESLEKQKMFLRSLSEGEFVIAAEIFFLLATRLPKVDLNTVKEMLVKSWRVWETRTHVKKLPYSQKSLAFMFGQVNRIVHDSQFTPLWSFVKLSFAWLHLDNAISGLDDTFNYIEHLRRYFHGAEKREAIDKLRDLPARLADTLSALHYIPKRTAQFKLFREVLLRKQAQVIQGSASKIDSVLSAFFRFGAFLSMILVLFFSAILSMRYSDLPIRPILGDQLTAATEWIPRTGPGLIIIIIVVLLIVLRFFRQQTRQFNSCEYGKNRDEWTGTGSS